jgi:hypothetical protein
MITSNTGLRLAYEQLSKTYQALAGLYADHPTAKPQWLAVMAEGFLDHARQLQQEIDAYAASAAACENMASTVAERGRQGVEQDVPTGNGIAEKDAAAPP